MSLEDWSYIAAIIGALVAIVGFPLLAWQLFIARSQRQDAITLSTSQVLLAADAVLATHVEVAAKLRPGGDWAGEEGKKHPTDDELWRVEPYLGVFERIFIAYKAKQVDKETLDQLYGYRLSNIWANQRIVDGKLQSSLKTYYSRRLPLPMSSKRTGESVSNCIPMITFQRVCLTAAIEKRCVATQIRRCKSTDSLLAATPPELK
jgi:hypothetical protein